MTTLNRVRHFDPRFHEPKQAAPPATPATVLNDGLTAPRIESVALQMAPAPPKPRAAEPERPAPRVATITIYGRIGHEGEPGVTPSSVRAQLDAAGPCDVLRILIDSPGGWVTEALAIAEMLTKHPAGCRETVVVGQAASCAGFLAMIGHERRMTRDAGLMIHNVKQAGDDTETQSAALTDAFTELFAEQSYDIPLEHFKEWSARETWFDAETAVRFGLATGYSNLPTRTPIDMDGKNRPEPPCDFPATRDFEARKARNAMKKSTPTTTSNPASATTDAKPASRVVEVPPLPESLKGRVITCAADRRALQAQTDDARECSNLNPFEAAERAQVRRDLLRLDSTRRSAAFH